jgi:DNA repair exonuclease SbcCD ATPase subunit
MEERMNGVYKSLKLKMQDTLHKGKAGPVPEPPAKGSCDLKLNEEMEKLERVVMEGFTKLKEAVKHGETSVAGEARQAEQVIGTLTANVAALDSKLKEAEEVVRQKDSSRQQIEETLKAKIQDLQNDLKGKEHQLALQAQEIDDLRSSSAAKEKQISELEAARAKAIEEAASHAARADGLAGASRGKIEKLEAEVKERQESLRQKDLRIKELERTLAVKIEDFESLARSKQELLAKRDAVIGDLKSQLKLLTKGIGEMSSFFKQAQAFAVLERQDASPSFPQPLVNSRKESPIRESDQVKAALSEEEKRELMRSNPAVVPSGGEAKSDVAQLHEPTGIGLNGVNSAPVEKQTETAQSNGMASGQTPSAEVEILPHEVLDRVSGELAEVAGLMTPLATLIVREHVEALGETIDGFPKNRLSELIESVSRELLDDHREDDFRQRLADLQRHAVAG